MARSGDNGLGNRNCASKLSATWTVKGTATLAALSSRNPFVGLSLITQIGPVLASSFALGVSGRDLLRDGDLVLFEIAQPMRAERGMATLATGIGRDWSTGGVIMGQGASRSYAIGTRDRFRKRLWFFAWALAARAGKCRLCTRWQITRAAKTAAVPVAVYFLATAVIASAGCRVVVGAPENNVDHLLFGITQQLADAFLTPDS